MRCHERMIHSSLQAAVAALPGVTVRRVRVRETGPGRYRVRVAFAGPDDAVARLEAAWQAMMAQQQAAVG